MLYCMCYLRELDVLLLCNDEKCDVQVVYNIISCYHGNYRL